MNAGKVLKTLGNVDLCVLISWISVNIIPAPRYYKY